MKKKISFCNDVKMLQANMDKARTEAAHAIQALDQIIVSLKFKVNAHSF